MAADDGPAARAATAGITAVWNGPCSGAVELARLAGPDDAELTGVDAARLRLAGSPPWRLAEPGVRVAVYEFCLTCGTPFDIYRWVNLRQLAWVWRALSLPAGVRREWERVLDAAGLRPSIR